MQGNESPNPMKGRITRDDGYGSPHSAPSSDERESSSKILWVILGLSATIGLAISLAAMFWGN